MNSSSSIDSNVDFVALPFSFYENPSLFIEPPPDNFKYGMNRATSSNGSVEQSSQKSFGLLPSLLSSASGRSMHSASSSRVGSPHSGHSHTISNQDSWTSNPGLDLNPGIINHEGFTNDFNGADTDLEFVFATDDKFSGSFVDPSLIQAPRSSYTEGPGSCQKISPVKPPAPAQQTQTFYPYCLPPISYIHTYPRSNDIQPKLMISSFHSGQSHQSSISTEFYDQTTEKGRCPHPECGRVFKNLKAHMLTHQSERPEKCPVLHCEYSQKGFARKYDKNRHTLTHFKGTMVCGFCPVSGQAARKSFNRADVFKRHLTSVHGVEQTAPNSRKRSPTSSNKKLSSYCQDATGKCSICSATFTNAQDFYEHLDDCVLRVVQQEEDDQSYISSSERAMMKGSKAAGFSQAAIGGSISTPGRPGKKGLIHSRVGIPVIGKDRKKRKHYPPSWGISAEKMQMKKRVLCAYDGERRLWKDDLMMHNEFEVRMKLADSESYVTDLGVETLKRVETFHNLTEEEKDPREQKQQPNFDLGARGIEQPSPNNLPIISISERKWSSDYTDATRKCSACSSMFNNAQDFYQHPDGCLPCMVQGQEAAQSQGSRRSSLRESSKTLAVPRLHNLWQNSPKDVKVPKLKQVENSGTPAVEIKTEDCETCFKTVEPASPRNESTHSRKMDALPESTVYRAESHLFQEESEDLAKKPLNDTRHFPEAVNLTPQSLRTEDDSQTIDWQSQDGSDQVADSEGEMSFMATPAPEDSYDDHPTGTDPRWLRVKNIVAEQISKSYVKSLIRTVAARNHATESGGPSKSPRSSNSGSTSSGTTPSRRSFDNRRLASIDEEQEDDDEERPAKRPKLLGGYGASDDGKLLACPYSKYDPTRYSELNVTEQQYRGCSSCFLTTIPRMKQHLYRVHSRPKHYCSCCFRAFEKANLLDEHVRARSCVVSQSPFEEKMTADQMTEIKRRTPGRERSKSWFTIFRILFPRATLPQSPFINKYLDEFVQNFLGFFEREAPGRLAAAIRSELGNTAPLRTSEEHSILDDVLETSIGRVVREIGQYGRTFGRLQQQESPRPAPTSSYLQTPPRDHGDESINCSSTEAESPDQPRQGSYQWAPTEPDTPQNALQSYHTVFTFPENTDHGVDANQADPSTFFHDLPTLPAMSNVLIQENRGSDIVDLNSFTHEWQRLYSGGDIFGLWRPELQGEENADQHQYGNSQEDDATAPVQEF